MLQRNLQKKRRQSQLVIFYLSHGWQKIQKIFFILWHTLGQRVAHSHHSPEMSLGWLSAKVRRRELGRESPVAQWALLDDQFERWRTFQSKQFQDDYLKSENLHLSLSLTFDISMTWFCVERWRLGVTDSETHRWMSIRTDPNNPFMAAAVAWNGKLHPWLNTDGQFGEHCSWVELLVPFVRDMLRAQHFFLVHSKGHCKLELIPCCVAQSLQSRNHETNGFSWNCALNGSILKGFSIVYWLFRSNPWFKVQTLWYATFKLTPQFPSGWSWCLAIGKNLPDSIRVLPPQD